MTNTSPWQLNGGNVYYDAGTVGIGTQSPAQSLHVAGTGPNGVIQADNAFFAADGFAGVPFFSERLAVGNAGNPPNFPLDVGGDGHLANFSNQVDADFQIHVSAPGSPTTLTRVGPGTTGDLILQNNGADRVTIKADGKVGIGRGIPTADLHVLGDIVATGSISEGSSRAFKDNIVPLTEREALEAFSGLQPVKFTYKADESGDLQLGFVAEDVPELVATSDRKGIGPMDLIAVLTTIVRLQQERIEAMEERLMAFEEQPRAR